MKQYLALMQDILDNGVVKKDRTGVGTLSVFGRQLRFDLKEGFPLVTTKKVHLKSIIHELLWFLNGDTNVKYLQENGVKIWDSWRRPYVGFTGKVIRIPRLKKEYVPFNGTFPLAIPSFDSIEDKKLAYAWKRMMHRCYDKTAHNYRHYGAKGVSVALRWHDVTNFVNDVKKLQNWFYKSKNWNDFELDKDYYGSNQYCPDGCVWLSRGENVHHAWVRIIKGDGTQYICRTYKHASQLTGLSKTSIHRFVKEGITPHLKGNNRIKGVKNWIMQKATTEDYLYRNEINDDGDLGPVYGKQWRDWVGPDGRHHDQISKVIQQLREDPDSRRIIVSAWNVGDLDDMALNPCHNYFQFYTTEMTLLERLDWYEANEPEKFANAPLINHEDIDDEERLHETLDREGIPRRKLSCFYMMRSNDYLLGAPFNVASYALLTHMIAQQLNMVPDELVYSGVDVHLYSNHLEQAKLQLTREPYPLPKLVIKRKPDSIFDYKYEDFELVGYQSHDTIKAPIAV